MQCQTSKISRHAKPDIQTFPVPSGRFLHIHIDLVGPLPSIDSYCYALTIIDRITRWPEIVPIKDLRAETTTQAFLHSWVSRFGIPETVTSDRGSQFTSEVWKTALYSLGIRPTFTTSYHPQCNGIVERFHRDMKNALRFVASDSNWINALPWILLGIQTAPRNDIGSSPAEILLGTKLRIPGMCFTDQAEIPDPVLQLSAAKCNVEKFTPKTLDRSKFKFKPFIPSQLTSADNVFLRIDSLNKGPLGPRYSGPYKVLKRNLDNGTFIIETSHGPDTVSISRLKAANCL